MRRYALPHPTISASQGAAFASEREVEKNRRDRQCWYRRSVPDDLSETMMFWRKKPPSTRQPTQRPAKAGKSLDEVAADLADSLSAYSNAAWRASQQAPDRELTDAKAKIDAARKIVTEGRLGYALGRCIPEHVQHWPSWITQQGFGQWVDFDAEDIAASEHAEKDASGSRDVTVVTIDFTFNAQRYRFIMRNRGMSYAPDSTNYLGEVELWVSDRPVAKFDIVKDSSREYPNWEFRDVRGLRVGPWMQDVLDITAQIDSRRSRRWQKVLDDGQKEDAKNIDLG
jgi:hypothetical protein